MGKRRARKGKDKGMVVERKIEEYVKGSNDGHKLFVETVKKDSDGCYSVFSIVDVERDKDDVVTCPHILRKGIGGYSSLAALGSRIYLIGGHDKGENLPSYGQVKGHGGTVYLDLNHQDEGWKAAAPLEALDSRYYIPISVAFCGQIFVFLDDIGEFFCPKRNQWVKLLPPPGVDYFCLSRPLLTDSSKNRLIMHHKTLKNLYAYYPAQARWEVLAEKFPLWTDYVVFHNDVLFFYLPEHIPGPFSEYNVVYAAYDVPAKCWLKVLLSYPFDPMAKLYLFRAFVSFGNGTMCLATYIPESRPPYNTNLFTVLFKISRISDHNVLVTPLSAKNHIISDGWPISNFLAIC